MSNTKARNGAPAPSPSPDPAYAKVKEIADRVDTFSWKVDLAARGLERHRARLALHLWRVRALARTPADADPDALRALDKELAHKSRRIPYDVGVLGETVLLELFKLDGVLDCSDETRAFRRELVARVKALHDKAMEVRRLGLRLEAVLQAKLSSLVNKLAPEPAAAAPMDVDVVVDDEVEEESCSSPAVTVESVVIDDVTDDDGEGVMEEDANDEDVDVDVDVDSEANDEEEDEEERANAAPMEDDEGDDDVASAEESALLVRLRNSLRRSRLPVRYRRTTSGLDMLVGGLEDVPRDDIHVDVDESRRDLSIWGYKEGKIVQARATSAAASLFWAQPRYTRLPATYFEEHVQVPETYDLGNAVARFEGDTIVVSLPYQRRQAALRPRRRQYPSHTRPWGLFGGHFPLFGF